MRIASWLMVVALAGCGGGAASSPGGSSTPSGAASAGSEAAAVAYPGPERPWAELDRPARSHHMSRHVVPAMTDLFVAYDAERFGDFGCPSCHGADASARHYAMPNPSLPVLYPTGSVGQHQAVAQFPEGVRFMFSEVTPAMRQLVGAAEFDEATHEGFTCFSCHPRASDDDPLSRLE